MLHAERVDLRVHVVHVDEANLHLLPYKVFSLCAAYACIKINGRVLGLSV